MIQNRRIVKANAAIVMLFLLVGVYWLASIGYGQPVGFQEYKPKILPEGIITTGSELYILRDQGFIPTFAKHIDVYFNLPNSWLAEWRSNGHLTNPCSDFPNEGDCHSYVTPHGQRYQLSGDQTSDTQNSYVYDVRFIKGDTEIWITARPSQAITTAVWSSVVDSFQKGYYDGLKVIYGSSSGA